MILWIGDTQVLDFEVDVDTGNVMVSLDELIAGLSLPERMAFLRRAGVRMMRSIQINFEKEGRPVRWAPLSPVTIANRRKGQRRNPRILRATGKLYRSIAYDVDPRGEFVEIGTNDKRAPDLQNGNPAKNLPGRKFVMFQDIDIERIERDAKSFGGGRLGRSTFRGK